MRKVRGTRIIKITDGVRNEQPRLPKLATVRQPQVSDADTVQFGVPQVYLLI